MFRRAIRYSQKTFGLYSRLKDITDRRIKPRIATVKIAVYIFSLQLANPGSLNNFSQSVVHPSVSTVARSADTMSLDDIRNVNMEIYRKARRSKMLAPFKGKWIGVVDGKEITTSDYNKCCHCKKRRLKDKNDGRLKYQYYHQFTAFILACSEFSITLDIEPILPGEGEVTSAYRLMSRVCKRYPKAFSVVIGDGLYLNGKTFKLLESHHKKAIAVLKEERRQLYDEAKRLCSISNPVTYREGGTSYRVWEHTIDGCWDGYGKAVRVIVSEETTRARVHSKDGGWEDKIEVTEWMWATNLDASESTGDLKNMVKICHSRWHIENRCFRETASMWNVEHIYRHSKNAIMVFLLFLFMAVNIFNIFKVRNIKDERIRTKLNLKDRIKADFLSIARPLPPIPI